MKKQPKPNQESNAARGANPTGKLRDEARALLKSGRFADAATVLERALALSPSDGSILSDLGLAYLFSHRSGEAVSALERAVRLSPSSSRAHFCLGIALAQTSDFEGALVAQRRAAELEPTLAEAHGRVGALLFRKGMRDEAASAYERAFAAAPTTSYGRLCTARAALARRRVAEAESILVALLGADPKNVEAQLVLADLLAETGRLAEAALCFERALAIAPWQTTAYSGLFSSKRMTERDRPLITQAAAQLGSAGLADRQRMALRFALGKAEEDLGNYGEAMQHWDEANAIRSTFAPFDRAKWTAWVDRIIATFPPSSFEAYDGDRSEDSTPILVLGMPRSGTTLLERILSSHAEVAGGGELTFWESNGPQALASLSYEAERRRVRADYLAVLRNIGPNEAHVTDKMPFNFVWIGLVHALFPNARIVHARRSAIDTCLSIYTTYFANDWDFASDRGNLVFFYREYERLMRHWHAVIPSNRLLEVSYEAATESPEATTRELLAFVGLPWDAACLSPQENKTPVVTANRWGARQPIHRSSVGRWRHFEPWLGELRELVQD